MNIALSLPSTVTGISFSFLTGEDVRRISVKQIVNVNLLDDLNRPTVGGLYDPALGPAERQDICATCHLSFYTCPGHFGHIELPAPVFHPLFMGNMLNLLRDTCLFCHRFKLSRTVLAKYVAKFRLLERGLLDAAQGVDDLHIRVRIKKAAAKKRAQADEDSSSDEEPDRGLQVPDESVEDFVKRINLYVAVHLARSPTSRRDHYKDGLVYSARKALISEFLKTSSTLTCQNEDCGCPAYTFRKEGYTKVIEYDLSPKQKAKARRKRPDVLLEESAAHLSNLVSKKPKRKAREDSDVEMGDPDDDAEDSEDVPSEDEEEQDEDEDDEELVKQKGDGLPRAANGKVKTKRGRNERVMTAEECRAHLRRLFRNEPVMCSLLYGRHGPYSPLSPEGLSFASPDMFFLDAVPVAPTRFRPAAKMADKLFEHPQNELLEKILKTSYRLRDQNIDLRTASQKTEGFDEMARKRIMASLLQTLVQLQVDVNSFMDSSKNPTPMRMGKLPPAGVKQGLEKKEGLFRKNMMGKRVNYAARSVISPDVNIESNEIGVPPVFAQKLTFPEPVTPANFHELRQRVITGPKGYPGATLVEYEDGHQVSLDKMTVEQRTAIANQLLTPQENSHGTKGGLFTRTPAINKKVYRHLRDGDILILNRQPTLHKPSMMAHKARVLKGEKTIRMHYANCNSYNADFDGDEMNIHFPQNQVSRAEATMIANTDNQYLVPTSGNPLRGLIQDHVVAGVWMTSQDSFFTREEYFQLLYGALRPEDEPDDHSRISTLPPTIWKPVPLWTGKQIISTILKNITPDNFEGLNLNAKTKVPGKLWGNDSKEDKVIFMDGELLCGVLDKAAFGASDYGIVHSVYELYGADTAGKLLGILSRLFTKFLQHRAFTCRMDDLALTTEGNGWRKDLLHKGRTLGTEGAIENFPSLRNASKAELPSALTGLLEDVLRDDNKMAGLDMTVKTKLGKLTSSISDACMPNGLLRKFPHNHMQTMTLSGAKGSAVNARQISCALGQQELEGRRVPVMVSGKTLPSFRPFETRAIAGGYVASRFLTGIKPQEFYFHCMAGREGLIDTAVKTSRSGYLQRCLIKHLEGIRVHYDHTVRGSDSSIYQFAYGGDALDVTKQKHLRQFQFIALNEVSFVNILQPRILQDAVDHETAVNYMKQVLKQSDSRQGKGSTADRDAYDPALSLYSPSRFLGSTSEGFATAVNKYIKTNPDGLIRDKGKDELYNSSRTLARSKHFRALMNVKYMRSLVEPGEAVGLLASQGVGEPSTQMTLNTFHFAGHGAANVTLGIPRLREIVMTASQKPKTPSMTMIVRPGVPPADIDIFCKRASRVTLAQVVHNITVRERLTVEGEARRTQFTVDLALFPKAEYMSEYDIDPAEILACFGSKFPLRLRKEMQDEMKKLDADLRSQIKELGQGKKSKESEDAEGDEEGDEGADDAAPTASKKQDEDDESDDGEDDEKRARQRKQLATYDDDSDEEGTEDEMKDDDIEAAYASDTAATTVPKPSSSRPSKKSLSSKRVSQVRDLFTKNMKFATDFSFDESKCAFQLQFRPDMPKLLLVGILERTCRATIIRQIPGVSECFQTKEESKTGETTIKLTTNGSNLQGFWQFSAEAENPIVETDDIYSNDIYAILQTYGVEMARAAILKEMGSVFGAYSIQVDHRHLELIADYMTFDGGYKAFNRTGISSNSSPLLKASYEMTAAFLSDATLYGDYDDLSTPSGNIVLGRPSLSGTGVFDVVMDVTKVP